MQNKKYIFLGQSILGSGGAQIYYLNKKKFLETQGWKVILFTFHADGKVVYKDFEGYYNNIFPELSLPLYYFTKETINRIVNKVVTIINSAADDRIVIESNWFGSAEWAELISQKIGAKHVIYLLSEQNRLEKSYKFFKFKFERGELSGISSHVIQNLFAPFETIPLSKIKPILAGCFSLSIPKDEVNINIDNLCKENYDYVISYFGRIDKMTPKDLREVCKFAKMVTSKRVLFLGMGYNNISEVYKFQTVIRESPKNIDIRIIPSEPIVPLSLFKISDVIIASAGCARIALRQKKLTITIDTDNDEVMGILGITTQNTTSSTIKSNTTLFDILYDILVAKQYEIADIKEDEYDSQCKVAIKEHLSFVNSTCQLEYFKLNNDINFKFDKYHFRLIVIRLLGMKLIRLIRRFKVL